MMGEATDASNVIPLTPMEAEVVRWCAVFLKLSPAEKRGLLFRARVAGYPSASAAFKRPLLPRSAGAAAIHLSRSEWATKINAFMEAGQAAAAVKAAIFQTGEALIAAKADLEHGEFQAMIRSDLTFAPRMAEVYMRIAAAPHLRNAKHVSLLPPRVGTLHLLARLPAQEFHRLIEDGTINPDLERPELTQLIQRARIVQERAAYEARADKGARAGDLIAMAEAGEKFAVIYADPPWEFKAYSGKGKQRSAERYYDTSSPEALKALPVGPLAAEDCALVMWATWPQLDVAREVVGAWGFEYKTAAFVWAKQNKSGEGWHMGMGYSTRANTEFCLLATRGAPMRLAMDVNQLIVTPVGEHSAKPEETRERIERLYAGPYLELFARNKTAGWTAWGNEIDGAIEPKPDERASVTQRGAAKTETDTK